MEQAISNIKEFPQSLLSWLDTKEDVLHLKITENEESPDTYLFLRKPVDDDMESILMDDNDNSPKSVLACMFAVFGFYSKSKRALVPTIIKDMMPDKYWDGIFSVHDRYWPIDFYESAFAKNIENTLTQFLTTMCKVVCFGEKIENNFSTELKRKFLVSMAQYTSKSEPDGNLLNTTKMYLSSAWDADMETYLKTKSRYIYAMAGYIGRHRRYFSDENLATYGTLYMLYPDDFLNRMIQRMYDNNFYADAKEHSDNDILRKYVQSIMKWLAIYVQIAARKLKFKPTPELEATRNVLKGLWALNDSGRFPKTLKAGIVARTDKYPKGVECMATIKCDALDVEDALALYDPRDIKIIAPEEVKGATISKEFPVKASDIHYLTYRNNVIYHKEMKTHD
mgnify:CR=1 FL=1